MAGSTLGNIYRITTWGESHGEAIGAVIDGCPAGLLLSEEDIQIYLDRRAPGKSSMTTTRKEADRCKILSGIFEGVTTGTPISVIVKNTSQRSADYDEIKDIYRPGHADYTYDMKYGIRDYRGGGRSSGRETIARVIGGAIAAKILSQFGITIQAFTESIGNIHANLDNFDIDICKDNPLYMPDDIAAKKAIEYVKELNKNGDSAGGIICCIVHGMKKGLGEPVFDKLDAEISKAVMSIGAIKGIEFGAGFASAMMTGSQNNDGFTTKGKGNDKSIAKISNNAGGILGGISDGSNVIFHAAIKPTPSISMMQESVDRDGNSAVVQIKGRHDPVIVPRAVVVIETMTAAVILDMLLRNMTSKMEYISKIYK